MPDGRNAANADIATIAAALTISERAVRERAAREGWKCDVGTRSGGRTFKTYPVSALPTEIQRALGVQLTPAVIASEADALKDYQRRVLVARLSILEYVKS